MKREQSLGLKERADQALGRAAGGIAADKRVEQAGACALRGEPMGDGRVRLVDDRGQCWGIAAAEHVADRTRRFFS